MTHAQTHRLLLTGASGQLAAGLIDEFADSSEITSLGIDRLDITNPKAVQEAVETCRPDILINCAAWNDVDAAEDCALDVLRVNSLGPSTLGAAAAAVNATFVHYSSDFVFSGEHTSAYTERDTPSPQNVYGMSKLLGEMLISSLPRTYVLRLESLFGGPRSRSTLDRILTALDDGQPVPAFIDRIATLSYVPDVARATRLLVDLNAPFGTYHVVNAGEATWHEIVLEAARVLGCPANIVPTRMADVPLRAARPRYCALSNAKLASIGIEIPDWRDAVRRHCDSRKRRHPGVLS